MQHRVMLDSLNPLKRLIFPLLALLLNACPIWPDDYEFEYEIIVTDDPVNLEGLNSHFDDYNSDLPYPYSSYGLYFSRNNNSLDFNIIHGDMSLSYHEKDDVLDVHCSLLGDQTVYERKLFDLINNPNSQLGPHSFFGPLEFSYFFFADDEGGDFDIKFTHHLKSDSGTYRAREVLNGPGSQ